MYVIIGLAFYNCLFLLQEDQDSTQTIPAGSKRLRLETVLSCGHTSVLFIPLGDTVSSTCVNLFLLRLQTNPFKTLWLIIYPGKEMPKPRETHHQERKGHSSPAHKYTLFNSHSHTTVMDGNNIYIRASGRQSFHPRVQILSRPRVKQKLDWWGEIFKRTSKTALI